MNISNHIFLDNHKKIFSFLLIGSIFLIAGCKNAEKENATDKKEVEETVLKLTQEQLKQASLTIGTVVKKEMQTNIQVNGVVDVPPQSLISISFPLGGYLKNSHLLPGTSVKKGEVIAIMEDQSYVQLQQDYLVAKAKMEYLQVDVQRQKELSDADAASKKNYQMVLSDFKTQQILIKGFEEKLKIIGINPASLTVANISRTVSIKSPINGYITHVNVNIGKYVNPSDVLFELVNPDDIHAAMTVFEKDFGLIKKGMKGTVALADNPNKKYEVDVLLTTKNINENRSGLVHCHFENNNHDLLPGMFLTGEFKINAAQVYALPQDAIVRFEGKEYIFIALDSFKFEIKDVETGTRNDGFVEIKNVQDFQNKNIVFNNAYALLGKLKNKMDD